MRLAVCYTRANVGISAEQVAVEAHLSNGLPSFAIVGLPETAVKESRHRVRSAIINSRFDFPVGRITVNLAPAGLPKEGGRYDLAIAVGILAASGQVPKNVLNGFEFAAELALNGALRHVGAVLPMAIAAAKQGRSIFLASEDAKIAAHVNQAKIFAAVDLIEVCAHIQQRQALAPVRSSPGIKVRKEALDLKFVNGQRLAKRALEIAAAGGHGLLMVGSPGVGKTMLASRMPSILPSLTQAQALETEAIHSISKKKTRDFISYVPPFRAPHHSASSIALIGGGKLPKPGEVSLAHNGVLFLDEFTEFSQSCLEVLREPLETGVANISRAAYSVQYPANFQFIAAMNPCPCGYAFDNSKCRCTPDQIQRYQNKISGPILDRIDLQVKMDKIKVLNDVLGVNDENESSETVQKRVIKSQQIQMARQRRLNFRLDQHALMQHCGLKEKDQQYLAESVENFGFSLRVYYRALRVARTIADLDFSDSIERQHIQEALWYRQLSRLLGNMG